MLEMEGATDMTGYELFARHQVRRSSPPPPPPLPPPPSSSSSSSSSQPLFALSDTRTPLLPSLLRCSLLPLPQNTFLNTTFPHPKQPRLQATRAARKDAELRKGLEEEMAVKIQACWRGHVSRVATWENFGLYRLEEARAAWDKADKLDMAFLAPRETFLIELSFALGRGLAGEELREAVLGLNCRGDDRLYKEDFLAFWQRGELPDKTAEDPADWEVCDDGAGGVYFYDRRSGESRWTAPRFKKKKLGSKKGGGGGAIGAAAKAQTGVASDLEVYRADQPGWQGQQQQQQQGQQQQMLLQQVAHGGGGSSSADAPTTDWEENDDGEGHTFWYNLATGESTWERPAVLELLGGGGGGGGGGETPARRADWEESTDPDSGRSFWYCAATGESRWEQPAFADGAASGGGGAWDDGLAPLPAGWEEAADEEGRVFWHHVASGLSQWERPI